MDCGYSLNTFSSFLNAFYCHILGTKFNRREIVDDLPADNNLYGKKKLIFHKDTGNWYKCGAHKQPMKMAFGPFLCQHIEPTVSLPPNILRKPPSAW